MKSVKAIIPAFYIPEIKYSINILFNEFLGVPVVFEINPSTQYFTFNVNDKFVKIPSIFFKEEEGESIYNISNIPKKVSQKEVGVSQKKFEIVSLYGDVGIQNHPSGFDLSMDLIASTFFMLSRWEENVNTVRDDHDRFPAEASCAWKNKFLDVPIVNEYVELIWELLVSIGYNGKRKERKYTVIPTHDEDHPFLWWNKLDVGKYLIKKGIQFKLAEIQRSISAIKNNSDPFDTHSLFMDLSEKHNVRSNFFFMANGISKFDTNYDLNHPKVLALIENIKERGHNIGIHPTYNSYNNADLLSSEVKKVQTVTNLEIKSGRQHFLRFSVPETWNNWESCGMEWESTLSYASNPGFRCGVCYSYSVFDCESRIQLKLKERPLIIMEASLILDKYLGLSLDRCQEKIENLKSKVKKYNGEFVFLWHNSSFHVDQYYPYESLLEILYE